MHALLGGATRDAITPYASLLPGDTFAAYRDALCASARSAVDLGFRAVKTEILINGPYAHAGMRESDERHTEVLAAVRETIGPDVTLMVDVGYRWNDADTCLATIQDWAEFDCFFLETPVWSDNLDEIARVAAQAPMPIAYGEWLATRFEFAELMETGVQIVQPDVGRVGGIGEAKIVCDMAQRWLDGRTPLLENRCLYLRHRPPRLRRR